MTLTVEQLDAALTMLQRRGVKSYSDTPGGGFAVEFFPAEPPSMPDAPKSKQEVDVCVCGHPEHAHMGGFCVECGNAEKCESQKSEEKK